MAVGAVLAATVWLLAIGIRGARLTGPGRARVARTAWLIAATMLGSAVLTLTGLAIGVAAVVWTGLIAGGLAWLSIPLWVLAMGRILVPSRAMPPIPETAAPRHIDGKHDHENRILGTRQPAGVVCRRADIPDRVR